MVTGDLWDAFSGNNGRTPPRVQPKPLPQIRGKRIDGVLYVRATDVADALGELGATTNRRLIAKLHAAAGPEQ